MRGTQLNEWASSPAYPARGGQSHEYQASHCVFLFCGSLGLCTSVFPPMSWAQAGGGASGGGAGGGGAATGGSGMGMGGPSVGTGMSGGTGTGRQGVPGSAGGGTNANGNNLAGSGSGGAGLNPQDGANTYQAPGAAGGVPPPGTPINPGNFGAGSSSSSAGSGSENH